jgi:rSAM/selenodomain-associated transferase 1
MNRSGSAIAVMAKQPEPGKVKTRLCPPLTPREAADLYSAFLLDTVGLASGVPEADLFLAYDPHAARKFFSRLFPRPVECIPQGTGDLGNRLSRVSRRLFSRGYRKLAIVASDTPHLPQECIQRAFNRLDETDVVLGPCDDGGYYLIGSRVYAPALFEGVAWSTSAVLERTTVWAEDAGLTWGVLPSCYDIDTMEDLVRLVMDLRTATGGRPVMCPRTREALVALAPVLSGDNGVLVPLRVSAEDRPV